MKDPSQFRERFKKWKEGTPIEEIYDNGRPTEYIEYMKRLAQPMAKNWEISEKEAYVHLLNDDSYDYYGWWKDGGKNIDPKTMEAAKPPLLPNDDGHFPDTYKTAKHPTFSNQSKYSGVVHPKYNPLGIHGGTWLGDTYLKGPMYLPGYSGGKNDNELPEVVVTPTKNTTAQVNQMRKIIPNNTLRNLFYDYLVEHTDNISSNDALNRFMKIYNWVDNPKIKLMNRYSDGSWESTNKYGTSNPDYFMHTISLGDDRTRDEYMNRSDLLAELSHAYQMMSKNANRLGLKPPFKSIVEQIRSRDDVDKYGRSGYDRIGNIEYNAHSIIEPVMIDYITGNIAEGLFHNALIDKINSVLHSTPKSLYPELYDLYSSYAHGKDSGIYIKPSKRGTFTAAAKKRGMSVLSFASKVLNNPSNYSKAMRKKALFAKNASKFKH